MRAFTLFSAFVAAAVSGVLATPGMSPAALIARQTTAVPDIPDECKASCAALTTISTCAADLKCMCTNAIGQGIVDCGTCGINFNKNDPNIAQYKAQFQSAVNSYASSCTSAGYPIGPFDVLGATSSGGSSAAGSSGGSSGTTSASGSKSTSSSTPNGAAALRVATGASAFAGFAVVMALVL